MTVDTTNARTAASRDSLFDLRINGTTPFLSHGDSITDRIREARGLVGVLESAFRTARDARNHPEVDTINNLNPEIVADALDGIATLLALAQHHERSR